ncbi:MAG: flagellar export chaperone FliS [Tissierellales bacterium]|jgi:flagellar protein FliS|nr:flagellar export chaperone FliS [Tissierellales bacterium]
MAINKGYQRYKQNSVLTASPEELTLMLYDGCLKFMRQAKLFIDENNIEKAHNAIIKAENIIDELNLTLKMEYPVSKALRPLYTFILEKLYEANMTKDASIIDEVYPMVEDLRNTWKEAMRRAKIERKTGKKILGSEQSMTAPIQEIVK